jgi:hypothetical protein
VRKALLLGRTGAGHQARALFSMRRPVQKANAAVAWAAPYRFGPQLGGKPLLPAAWILRSCHGLLGVRVLRIHFTEDLILGKLREWKQNGNGVHLA